MNTKERITKQATSLFEAYGVRSVSMDDIAKALAISKKTIYQYFNDKNSIVEACVYGNTCTQKEKMEEILDNTEGTMEKMFRISEHIRATLRSLNPALLYDLQKYHPEAWKLHRQYMFDKTKKTLVGIIKQGIEEGYFRSDLDVEALVIMRIHQMEMGFNPEIFSTSDYDISHLQMQFFEHFLYGISTQKGHAKIQEYKENQYVS